MVSGRLRFSISEAREREPSSAPRSAGFKARRSMTSRIAVTGVDLVIVFVGADEFDQDCRKFIGNMHHQTKLVAADIEDEPIIGDKLNTVKISSHIRWRFPCCHADEAKP